jgi:hypothetical protein
VEQVEIWVLLWPIRSIHPRIVCADNREGAVMTPREIAIEAAAKAIYARQHSFWRPTWEEHWNDPTWDQSDKTLAKSQAQAAYDTIFAALEAGGAARKGFAHSRVIGDFDRWVQAPFNSPETAAKSTEWCLPVLIILV